MKSCIKCKKYHNTNYVKCEICRKKLREYMKEYYHNKASNIIKNNVNKRRKKIINYLQTIKIKFGCKICGYNKSPFALDFNHINNKKFNIAWGYKYSFERLQEELKKVEILCANCHRILTYKNRISKNYHNKFDSGSLRKKRNLIFINSIKQANKCVLCGANGLKHPEILDFDHLDPSTKNFGIGQAINSQKFIDKIKKEILKCQIICANCHRVKTYSKCTML